jgi:hypothetical protein
MPRFTVRIFPVHDRTQAETTEVEAATLSDAWGMAYERAGYAHAFEVFPAPDLPLPQPEPEPVPEPPVEPVVEQIAPRDARKARKSRSTT